MIDLSTTVDLTTKYLGLKLKNPLVASSSPMCEDVGNIRRMEDAGAAAVVLHSLFEEQMTLESEALDRATSAAEDTGAESTTAWFPVTGCFEPYCRDFVDPKPARVSRSRTPAHSGVSGGISIAIQSRRSASSACSVE